MFSLENKIIIITGGGSGIGRAMAILFAKQKGNVNILDMNEASAMETVHLITEENAVASFAKCNVADENEVQTVITEIVSVNNRIDILINNAGIAHVGMPKAQRLQI